MDGGMDGWIVYINALCLFVHTSTPTYIHSPSSIYLSIHPSIHPFRYEVERDHYNADGEELRRLLAVRGIMYDRLKRSSDAHNYALHEVGIYNWMDGCMYVSLSLPDPIMYVCV